MTEKKDSVPPSTISPPLRVSLSALFKEHRERQKQLREDNEQKRKAVVASVEKVTQLMVDNLNSGVAHVFANQKKIEQEVQKLDHQATKLNKQTANWIKLIEDFNNALKEVGDLENWAQTIESDMRKIAKTIELVHETAASSTTTPST
jgi:predicted ribonuclease toxin of YeeF-YezG toxin-antitoxin module